MLKPTISFGKVHLTHNNSPGLQNVQKSAVVAVDDVQSLHLNADLETRISAEDVTHSVSPVYASAGSVNREDSVSAFVFKPELRDTILQTYTNFISESDTERVEDVHIHSGKAGPRAEGHNRYRRFLLTCCMINVLYIQLITIFSAHSADTS